MAELKLKNPQFRIPATRLAFYDGSLPVVNGTVTIPHGRPAWAGSAYQRGFRYNENGQALSFADIMRLIRTVPEIDPDEADETQPVTEDISYSPQPAPAPAEEPLNPDGVPGKLTTEAEDAALAPITKPKATRKTKRKVKKTK